ncbi:MAG: malonyl-[acyl-carrier protein] O-methyltransferase [Betaproteobacteria bacterium]|nr:MAG: malonyl-[acyl-carrier protein] O-methyltransferase [Betaproteobacteria bacterium]
MTSAPDFAPPDPRDVDPAAVRRAFSRAAATYDAAAALQREVGARLVSRLDVVRLAPQRILDVGCGTGEATAELAARYPDAHVVGLDLALPMAQAARERLRRGRSLYRRLLAPIRGARGDAAHLVCADANLLPFAGVAFDLVFSSLALQWVNDLSRPFAEVRRVLRVGGLFTFTTFGPDTLKELRAAFARADGHTHVSRFVDMHDVGDMLVAAGFADPVMDMETITVTYASPRALMLDLKALGATNATRGRPRGLTGRGRIARVFGQLEKLVRDGALPATYEVVYGHAWKGEPRTTPDGLPIVRLRRDRPR